MTTIRTKEFSSRIPSRVKGLPRLDGYVEVNWRELCDRLIDGHAVAQKRDKDFPYVVEVTDSTEWYTNAGNELNVMKAYAHMKGGSEMISMRAILHTGYTVKAKWFTIRDLKEMVKLDLELYPEALIAYMSNTEIKVGTIEVRWDEDAKAQLARLEKDDLQVFEGPAYWRASNGERLLDGKFRTYIMTDEYGRFRFYNAAPQAGGVVSEYRPLEKYLPDPPTLGEQMNKLHKSLKERGAKPEYEEVSDTVYLTEYHRLILNTYSNPNYQGIRSWREGDIRTNDVLLNFLMDYLGRYQTKEAVVMGIGQIEEELTRLKEALD